MASQYDIEAASERDLPEILEMIRGLAEFEHLLEQVEATEPRLREALFGPRPAAEALIARRGGATVGYAIVFFTFSTFLAERGLYLEDLYVKPQWRHQGAGRQLLAHVTRLALSRGCRRVDWSVLRWNENALRLYRGIGAEPIDEWIGYRLSGEALRRFAEVGAPAAR